MNATRGPGQRAFWPLRRAALITCVLGLWTPVTQQGCASMNDEIKKTRGGTGPAPDQAIRSAKTDLDRASGNGTEPASPPDSPAVRARRARAITAILRDLAVNREPEEEEEQKLRKDPGFVPALIDVVSKQPAKVRRHALDLVVSFGCPYYTPRYYEVDAADLEPLGEWIAPYVNDARVVRHLVWALSDPDGDVRDMACRVLVEEVPDSLMRPHTSAILRALEAHPEISDAARLLGKTGDPAAVKRIQHSAVVRDANPRFTRLALARLGDKKAEEAAVRAYKEAREPAARRDAAQDLGYLATARAVRTLAEEIRTAETYVWTGRRARRSMRVHIIEGLHRAFLSEPLFFPPVVTPHADSYYDAVEGWLTRKLGVTWKAKRPPFLYEDECPVLPGER